MLLDNKVAVVYGGGGSIGGWDSSGRGCGGYGRFNPVWFIYGTIRRETIPER